MSEYFTCWGVFPLQAATTMATTLGWGLTPTLARVSVMFLSAKNYIIEYLQISFPAKERSKAAAMCFIYI